MALSAVALTHVFAPTTAGAAGVSAITLNISGATTGDVVVAVIFGFNDAISNTTFTPSAGWTELTTADSSAGGTQSVWIGWRVKQAGDTTFTWTFVSGPGGITGFAWDITGANTTTPLDIASSPVAIEPASAPYTVVTNTATAAATGELVFIVAGGDGGFAINTPLVSSTTPTGFTKDFDFGVGDNSAGLPQVAGFRANAVSTSTAIPAFTTTFSGGGFSGFVPLWAVSFVIKPASGVVHNLAPSDTASTVTDAPAFAHNLAPGDTASTVTDEVSLAILPSPPTPPDQASVITDLPTITVTRKHTSYGQGAPIKAPGVTPTFRYLFLAEPEVLEPAVLLGPPTANDTQT